MSKIDQLGIELLKDLETLTDRSGSFSLATPAAQTKMRSLVADFVAKIEKQK
jgi:hypothetical protein